MGKQWKLRDFIFGGYKITADGDCCLQIKRGLFLGRKAMTNLDSILKSRDITLPTKVHLVKAMVFPVIMYGCESWTIKKAECWRIDAFEPWCWRRLLRVPWTARRSNQSILKEISPEYSLEGLMLKWNTNTLATWCEELTHWERPWCWGRSKTGEGDNRGWDGWMVSPTQWTWIWANSGRWWRTGKPDVLQSMGSQSWTQLSNWTTTNKEADALCVGPTYKVLVAGRAIQGSQSEIHKIVYSNFIYPVLPCMDILPWFHQGCWIFVVAVTGL